MKRLTFLAALFGVFAKAKYIGMDTPQETFDRWDNTLAQYSNDPKLKELRDDVRQLARRVVPMLASGYMPLRDPCNALQGWPVEEKKGNRVRASNNHR